MGPEKPKAGLLPGRLDMLVLRIIDAGPFPWACDRATDSAIVRRSVARRGRISLPALQRLELNGWTEDEWGLSANNRRAGFYKLIRDGRRHLAEESARYRQVTGAVAPIMGFASSYGEMHASRFTLEAFSTPFTVLAGSQ